MHGDLTELYQLFVDQQQRNSWCKRKLTIHPWPKTTLRLAFITVSKLNRNWDLKWICQHYRRILNCDIYSVLKLNFWTTFASSDFFSEYWGSTWWVNPEFLLSKYDNKLPITNNQWHPFAANLKNWCRIYLFVNFVQILVYLYIFNSKFDFPIFFPFFFFGRFTFHRAAVSQKYIFHINT